MAAVGASAASVVAAAAGWKYLESCSPPYLEGGQDEAVRKALQHCRALRRAYWPVPGISLSGLASSALAAVRGVPAPKGQLSSAEETLRLADGGTISLDWWPGSKKEDGRPVVLVLPGLGSSSRSLYIRIAMARLHRAGLAPVALNYRGVAHLEPTSRRIASADSWKDLPEVVARVASTRPGAPLCALGYSMGGVMLARYLGETGHASGISAGALVSAPLAYEIHGRKLQNQKKLSFAMALPLKAWFVTKRRQFMQLMPTMRLQEVLRARSLHEMIDAVLCESNGYSKADDYFKENDPTPVLPNITCPLLVLNAVDDPLVGPELTPYEAIKKNSRILLAETSTGGHLGWGGLSKRWGPHAATSWADDASGQFLRATVLGEQGSKPEATLRSRL